MKTLKPLLWLAAGGTVLGVAILVGKKMQGPSLSAPSPPAPPVYGETTRVALPVPAGWRRATSAEVAALPELSAQASALANTPGFASMPYGALAPFVASDGRTYATWIEQHYHEPGGPLKPWGLHHGVTILAKT